MRIVKFKNKNAKHSLRIAGKTVEFRDGIAKVQNYVANAIKELNDPDYKVIEPEIDPLLQPMKFKKKTSRKKKSKKDVEKDVKKRAVKKKKTGKDSAKK